MHVIRAIVFDRDGTLFNCRRTLAASARAGLMDLADGNAAKARALGRLCGFDFDAACFLQDSLLLDGESADIAEALLVALPGATARAVISRLSASRAEAAPVEATPLVPLLSELLARGIDVAVATNGTAQETRRQLGKTGVLRGFRAVINASDGYAPKPAPDMLHAFLDMAGHPAKACVMVGDSVSDLVAGRKAGMVCIGVLTGKTASATLAPHADAILPHIGALPAWLDRNAVSRDAA